MLPFEFYLKLGFGHIANLNGFVHILFLIALCAVYQIKQWRRILILVTAFTIGHSITLFLVSLNLSTIPSRIIKVLIPTTIILTSLQNIRTVDRNDRFSSMSKNYAIALFFGLIHGMDFSNYFRALILSPDDILIPLFGFNIGIELGQLVVVLLIVSIAFLFLTILKVKHQKWNLFVSGAAFGISFISIVEILFEVR